jgi:cytochrome b561
MDRNRTSSVDEATRIAAGDDRTHYDPFAMGLHWATVFLVLANFLLAEFWGFFARDTRHTMIVTHMSFGILLAAAVVTRIVWRLIPGHQMPSVVSGWTEMASKAVHWFLYALLVVQAVLGFVLRWSGGEAMSFFGFEIASPMVTVTRPVHHFIGDLHNWTGWVIIVTALGHAGAALYHHYIVRDNVLRRMLPSGAVQGGRNPQ